MGTILRTACRLVLSAALLLTAAACSRDTTERTAGEGRSEVVVYTALDQIFSEPILNRFESQTGIRVRAVYDTEAAKTVGLVNRLLSEKSHPRCDVFWNNEILRTLLLKREGITEAYHSPNAAGIPEAFRDPEGHWTGFAARARVIIYNTHLVPGKASPKLLEDLTDPKWKGRCAIANPLFGTTATHAAVLWWLWGPDRAQKFFESCNQNDVIQLPGNATVRDQVALGETSWGLTDSDDANGALLDDRPVEVTFPIMPDADGNLGGILLIPNTVSVIRGAPHPKAARKLVDYLLSPEVEEALAGSRSAQLPLRRDIAPPPRWAILNELPHLDVDWDAVLDALQPSAQWLDENYVR